MFPDREPGVLLGRVEADGVASSCLRSKVAPGDEGRCPDFRCSRGRPGWPLPQGACCDQAPVRRGPQPVLLLNKTHSEHPHLPLVARLRPGHRAAAV